MNLSVDVIGIKVLVRASPVGEKEKQALAAWLFVRPIQKKTAAKRAIKIGYDCEIPFHMGAFTKMAIWAILALLEFAQVILRRQNTT